MGINKPSQKLITIGLYLSELRSLRNQSILRNTCYDLKLSGFYKPGKPGKVIVQSSNSQSITQFLFIIKSLDIKQCSLNALNEFDLSSASNTNTSPIIEGFSKCSSDLHLQELLNNNDLGAIWSDLNLKSAQSFPTWEMLQQGEAEKSEHTTTDTNTTLQMNKLYK